MLSHSFFKFTPKIGVSWSNLTNISRMGWFNHQLGTVLHNEKNKKTTTLDGFNEVSIVYRIKCHQEDFTMVFILEKDDVTRALDDGTSQWIGSPTRLSQFFVIWDLGTLKLTIVLEFLLCTMVNHHQTTIWEKMFGPFSKHRTAKPRCLTDGNSDSTDVYITKMMTQGNNNHFQLQGA